MSEDIPANAVPLSRLDAQRQLEKLQKAAHFIGVKLEVQLKSPRADAAHDGHSAWDITQHKGELAYLNAVRLFIAHVRQHEALLGWNGTQTKNVAGPYENARDGEILGWATSALGGHGELCLQYSSERLAHDVCARSVVQHVLPS
jgi:hypothetical protein